MKQIIYLNNSAISKFGNCNLALSRSVGAATSGMGYRSMEPMLAADWGTCFHKFAARYYSDGNYLAGLKEALAHFQSLPYEPDKLHTEEMLKLCILGYVSEWKGENIQICYNIEEVEKADAALLAGTITQSDHDAILRRSALIEQKFEHPFFEDEHYDVRLFGVMDLICQYNTEICIMDHKTTAAKSPDAYLEGYRLNPQMRLYKMVLNRMARLNPKNAFLADAKIVINGIFLTSAKRYQRSEAFDIKDWEVDETELMLTERVKQFIHWLRHNPTLRDGMITDVCNKPVYGKPCIFKEVCAAPNAATSSTLLDLNFIKKVYDPNIYE